MGLYARIGIGFVIGLFAGIALFVLTGEKEEAGPAEYRPGRKIIPFPSARPPRHGLLR